MRGSIFLFLPPVCTHDGMLSPLASAVQGGLRMVEVSVTVVEMVVVVTAQVVVMVMGVVLVKV